MKVVLAASLAGALVSACVAFFAMKFLTEYAYRAIVHLEV